MTTPNYDHPVEFTDMNLIMKDGQVECIECETCGGRWYAKTAWRLVEVFKNHDHP